MKPFLMGAEVENSMSGRVGDRRIPPEQIHALLLRAICDKHKWLADLRSPHGVYLDNGSRYYLDTGAHNELSSPEFASPRQVAVYDRAAEKILREARRDVLQRHQDMQISITKNNINVWMPDAAAWGQHEAYTCWVPLREAAPQLIPHLVSRLPYAGAGCLSTHPQGMGFELSQRARHMTREVGSETTHDRAIFCTRAWKPADVSSAHGWTRTNLISKDSQRCSFGMYLTYGVTALLFMIVNEGRRIGRKAQLQKPVQAMREISLDPWLKTKVRMADGRRLTALEIQRLYLAEAEPLVHQGGFPAWATEVLDHWSATLDQLEKDPLRLARRLDTYLKLTIFQHELSRAGYDWVQLRRGLQLLDTWRRSVPEQIVRAILAEDENRLSDEERCVFWQLAKDRQLKKLGLEPIRFAVRLQALELNYHELDGLFDQLDAAGQVDPVVVLPEEVEHAVHHAPPGGRAEARSRCIADLSGQDSWTCDWQGVMSQTDGQWYDMRDPFSGTCELSEIPEAFTAGAGRGALAHLLARLGSPTDLLG